MGRTEDLHVTANTETVPAGVPSANGGGKSEARSQNLDGLAEHVGKEAKLAMKKETPKSTAKATGSARKVKFADEEEPAAGGKQAPTDNGVDDATSRVN